jgi:hypothetical protein
MLITLLRALLRLLDTASDNLHLLIDSLSEPESTTVQHQSTPVVEGSSIHWLPMNGGSLRDHHYESAIHDANEIVPNLYLTSFHTSNNFELHRRIGTRLIVRARTPLTSASSSHSQLGCINNHLRSDRVRRTLHGMRIREIVLDISHNPNEAASSTQMFRSFGKAYYWINRYLRRGLPVVVHGDLGCSRSAMLVMAYIVRSKLEVSKSSDVKGKMRLALSTMLARRKIVAPRAEFVAQLEIYTHIYKPYDTRAILTSSLEKVLIGALSNPDDRDLLARSREWRDELRKL